MVYNLVPSMYIRQGNEKTCLKVKLKTQFCVIFNKGHIIFMPVDLETGIAVSSIPIILRYWETEYSWSSIFKEGMVFGEGFSSSSAFNLNEGF